MPLLQTQQPTSKGFSFNLVVTEASTGAQCPFAMKQFYKNGDSFVIVVFHLPMPSRPGFETLWLLALH
jgi:hypothetical protein